MSEKGIDIIQHLYSSMEDTSPETLLGMVGITHASLLEIHSRALSAHCECLGMNAENCWAASIGQVSPYRDDDYLNTMQKWGLIDKEGKPLI